MAISLYEARPQSLGAPQVRRWPRRPPATPALAAPAAATTVDPAPQAFPWPVTAAEGRLRAYAVWVIPGHPELRGVHVVGTLAWQGLLPALPGGFYSYRSGTRLRAYESPALAVIGYLQEIEKHNAPALVIIRWPTAQPQA